MKEQIVHEMGKRKLLITLLFSCIALISFSYKSHAQGWTLTFQLAQSGPCGGGQLPILPTFPNLGMPTLSQCESLRQMILSVRESYSVYDGGNYIGECSVFYTCTPCTGSDIVAPGQVSPGDISFDGQFQGKPFFTTHESSAFEDWARDYKLQLESYGITSILGNNLTIQKIPLTGDINFDKFYNSQTAAFNPASPINNSPARDASVVNSKENRGVVQLLTTPEEQAQRDKWMEKQGLENLKKIPKNGISDLDASNFEHEPGEFWGAFVNDPEIVKMEQHALFIGIGMVIAPIAGAGALAAGATVLEAEAVGTAATFLVPIAEEGTKAFQACIDGKCPTSAKILENMGIASIPNALGTVGEAFSGLVGKIPVTGISKIDAIEIAKETFKSVFGTLDQTRDAGETFNIKY